MKLELKHIAPYLPYGLKARLSREGIFNLDNEYLEPNAHKIGFIDRFSDYDGEFSGRIVISEKISYDFQEQSEIEIILIPLSEIPDDIFNLLGFADEEDMINNIINEHIPYGYMTLLISKHFDVFGLIEKGLAIDINTIE